MFRRIGNAWRIMVKSVKFMFKKPLCLIPFVFALVLNIAFLVVIQLNVNLDTLSNGEMLGLVFLVIFVETFFVSIASLILLELLEQYETDGDMRFGKAIGDALTKDLFRALPIILGWSIIQFLIMILEALFSGDSDGRGKSFLSRFISRLFRAIKKGVRMGAMLIMAAIAWEDIPPGKAYQKGKSVYKSNFVEIASSIGISSLFSLLLILPLILIVIIISVANLQVGVWFIYLLMFYFAFMWSAGLLIEQLFAAELYLWYRVYEKEKEEAEYSNSTVPLSIHSVKKPSFFDEVPDFITKDRRKKDTQMDY